jgi:hypothetical protein
MKLHLRTIGPFALLLLGACSVEGVKEFAGMSSSQKYSIVSEVPAPGSMGEAVQLAALSKMGIDGLGARVSLMEMGLETDQALGLISSILKEKEKIEKTSADLKAKSKINEVMRGYHLWRFQMMGKGMFDLAKARLSGAGYSTEDIQKLGDDNIKAALGRLVKLPDDAEELIFFINFEKDGGILSKKGFKILPPRKRS